MHDDDDEEKTDAVEGTTPAETDEDRFSRVMREVPHDVRSDLMMQQCRRQIALFKTQLRFSGNDTGFFINMCSLKWWERELQIIADRKHKE